MLLIDKVTNIVIGNAEIHAILSHHLGISKDKSNLTFRILQEESCGDGGYDTHIDRLEVTLTYTETQRLVLDGNDADE